MNSLKWLPAHSPLKPVGMIIANEKSSIQRLLELDSERLSSLRGSYFKSGIILLGNEEHLPWIPSAIYLGQDESASQLLVPTHLSPSLPIDWVHRAIQRKFGSGQYAIDPANHNVYNVVGALNVSIKKLQELLEEVTK